LSVSKPLATVAAIALGLASLSAQQAPRFAGGTDAILIDVLVTRSGVAVDGLTAADFVVRDSGVAQTPQLVATGTLPVNLLLAFDTSASVRGTQLEHLKTAAKAAVASLRANDEAALLTFSHNVLLRTGWTTSRETLTKAIDSVTGLGLTALNDAAFSALAMTPRPGARRLILFFTDGDDTSSWTSSADLLQLARRSDAIVYNVTLDGVGNSGATMARMLEGLPAGDRITAEVERRVATAPALYRAAVLPLLALETGGESMRALDPAKLGATFTDIISRFSKRYLLAYTPTGVPAAGWHPIQVEVTGGGEVTARKGYTK